MVLTAALVAVAFVTDSTAIVANLGANTWIEILLVAIGCGLGATVLLRGGAGRRWGATTLALFVAVAAFTALSIAWSVAPDISWMEAGRTAAYAFAFGSALAVARLFPERWRALVWAVALVAVVLSAWAVLVRVFPAALDADNVYGRLTAPFGYWNATGTIAALGLPAWLWVGSRREGPPAPRALAVPAVALLVAVVALSYSRSAVLAAILGVATWFALAPVRLRGAAVLALGGAGGAVISAWALGAVAFTQDGVAMPIRVSDGHTFGLVVVLVLGALGAGGWLAACQIDRAALSAQHRRRLGVGLIGVLALMPIAGIGTLAGSSRGLTGEVSHIWSSLTSTHQYVGDTPGRLVDLANSRPQYWREGVTVGSHALWHGAGAGGFQFAQTRYTNDTAYAAHAHSYMVETFADLGLIGLALNLLLLVAWGIAAARPVRRTAGRSGTRADTADAADAGLDAERAGMAALLGAAVAFGASSSIDWTWFIPGVALPALLCAGWLAGRGPLPERVGLRERRARTRSWVGAPLAVSATVALGVLCMWMVWQPLRSADDANAAMNALAAGNGGAALDDAQSAAAEDPVAWQPLWDLSLIDSALGKPQLAQTELLDGVVRQPDNAQAWYELGEYELGHRQARAAVGALQRAHELDLADLATDAALAQAQAQAQARS